MRLDIGTPSDITGGAGAIITQPTPKTTWFSSMTQPWVNAAQGLFGTAGRAITGVGQRLPDIFYEWGMDRLGLRTRTVPEGPGTTVSYVQPVVPGGAPAEPHYQIPGQGIIFPVPGGVQQAGGINIGIIIAIGIGLVVLLSLRK